MVPKTPDKKLPPVTWVKTPEKNSPNHAETPKNNQGNSTFPVIVCANEWLLEKSNPSSILRKRTKCRVMIELRRNPRQGLNLSGYRDLEMGVKGSTSDWSENIERGDVVVFNLFKRNPSSQEFGVVDAASSSSDDDSVSTIGFRAVDDYRTAPPEVNDGSQWQTKLSVPLSKVNLKLDKSKCLAEFSLGKQKKSVQLHFSNEEESRSFLSFVKSLKSTLVEVASRAIEADRNSMSPSVVSSPIKFLVEIISATDLKPVNRSTSDPYVVVKYGGEKIHTTSVIYKKLDPIWTIGTNSLFVFTLNPGDYYAHEMMFEVRDKETFVAGSTLGQAVLPNQRIVKSRGERIELKLKHLQQNKDAQGFLAVRCRRAKASDIDFIENFDKKKATSRKSFEDFVTPSFGKQRALPVMRKKFVNGIKYHFARPAQENRDSQWLTSEEIDRVSLEESQLWTEVGEGDLGKLYVEVIRCDKLPDMDKGSLIPGDTTDAFVTCVFEDAVVTTDIVKDCTKPRFMPWTRRAFKFHISKSTSPLYVGVFDHDIGPSLHDPIGRIAIPLNKFVSGTIMNLTYDIFDSHQVGNRRKQGSITLRISVEWFSQRKLYFESLQQQDWKNSVHLNSKKNRKHVEFTVKGHTDIEKYDLKTFFSLLNEILEYQNIYFDIIDALKTVLLWRGHYHVYCFYLPLHSIILLIFAMIITEFPEYSMSVFFASIAWFMLACLDNQRQRPSSWAKPPSYPTMLAQFVTNRARPMVIEKHESKEADSVYMNSYESRREGYEAATEEFWDDFNKEGEIMEEMKAQSTQIFKKRNQGVRLKLFQGLLYPIQKILLQICIKLRFISKIVSWDQLYISFWITTSATVLSIVSIFLWDDFVLWSKRVILYGLFGPHMKLLDIFYFKRLDALTDEEKTEIQKERSRRKRNRYRKTFLQVQKKKEDRVKEEAVKKMLFGPEIVVIPDLFTPEKYESVPNHESSAYPLKPQSGGSQLNSNRFSVMDQR
eukprot:scaffold3655_cov260-Chaetoceros_neogracile.AAC.1